MLATEMKKITESALDKEIDSIIENCKSEANKGNYEFWFTYDRSLTNYELASIRSKGYHVEIRSYYSYTISWDKPTNELK